MISLQASSKLASSKSASGKARALRGVAAALALGALAPAATAVLAPTAAYAKGPDSLADLATQVSDAVVNISATRACSWMFFLMVSVPTKPESET